MAKQKRSKKARKAKKQQRRLAKLELKIQKGQVSQEQYQKVVNKLRGIGGKTLVAAKQYKQTKEGKQISVPTFRADSVRDIRSLIDEYRDLSTELSIYQRILITFRDKYNQSTSGEERKNYEDVLRATEQKQEKLEELKQKILKKSVSDEELHMIVTNMISAVDSERTSRNEERERSHSYIKEQRTTIDDLIKAGKDKIDSVIKDIENQTSRERLKVEFSTKQQERENRRLERLQERKLATDIFEAVGTVNTQVLVRVLSSLPSKTQQFIIDTLNKLIDEGRSDEIALNIRSYDYLLADSVIETYERYEDIDVVERSAYNLLRAIYGQKIPQNIIIGLDTALELDEKER